MDLGETFPDSRCFVISKKTIENTRAECGGGWGPLGGSPGGALAFRTLAGLSCWRKQGI